MHVSVVLFTSDLRLTDHPPLRAALDAADAVVPLFVRDRAVEATGFAAPNRNAFLDDCLADLDSGLRERGGRLVVRSGDLVAEVCRVVTEADADEVHMSAGHTRFATVREERLRSALEAAGRRLFVHDAVTVAVPPGTVTPASSDHFAVFTPYYRQWAQVPLRPAFGTPRRVSVPEEVGGEKVSAHGGSSEVSPALPPGGESAARGRVTAYWRRGLGAYEDTRDDLAADATSRFSPHLHFGTLSPVELVRRARRHGGPGAEAFVRQLAWRDFHRQVLAARPDAARADYRTKHDRWRTERTAAEDIEAWRTGRTGYPLIDAAMRQLRHEGWMHNRARLLTASFLAKTLYVDWRIGAAHFLHWLVDGDVANNQLNWQWMAGTGTDTRPNRVLNPVTQAKKYDPEGTYVRRWVPELAGVDAPLVHEPWKLPGLDRAALDYPDPVIELSDGLDRFRHARGKQP
ncbi:cryptochrome/photolyase family protein [Streptomyces spectabilis]|uniref:Deoxyribodipyrimidine photo-lyase n=1 Tax=Streptomyces spectabilis TaxID=68270 RepID=A0A5P2XH57_STRST|nr:deoxyribodipyrimidine photo-lyase [Streptomyces spectabilis]MBB5102535.1 deoxyribodipyrimidine photo-lyase [Streptomyces spectabilis]MCI3907575.1 DNA photolyase family protein [Streptomyces spectabilis]QEV64263.1 deoxyribodipyrimidine photo-lyase [Streptomyces spectabilis]GGV31288.1 deoxyribodipyrimidine photo-lyase [Streptomyces spectabilis]